MGEGGSRLQATAAGVNRRARPGSPTSAGRVEVEADPDLRHYRRLPESGDSPDLLASPSHQDLERATIARQELGRVEEALGRLPERERLVMLLVDVEGVEREEVCRALGLTATHLRVLAAPRTQPAAEDGGACLKSCSASG